MKFFLAGVLKKEGDSKCFKENLVLEDLWGNWIFPEHWECFLSSVTTFQITSLQSISLLLLQPQREEKAPV